VSGEGYRPAANQRNIAPTSIEEARHRSDNGWCLRRCRDGNVGKGHFISNICAFIFANTCKKLLHVV